MPIPPGRYTRQQIRDLALNRAGNRALDADAISWLAQILFDLYTQYDWPFLNVRTTVTISGPTFTLPTDFYQTQDDAALKPLTRDGESLAGAAPLLEIDAQSFDLREHATAYGQPSFWTCDRATGEGRVTPNPVGTTLVCQLRYKRIPAEPAEEDEADDVPVFPWHNYLVQAVYCQALQHERDPRLAEGMAVLGQMFSALRRASSPRMAQHATIPLDPTHFRTPYQGD